MFNTIRTTFDKAIYGGVGTVLLGLPWSDIIRQVSDANGGLSGIGHSISANGFWPVVQGLIVGVLVYTVPNLGTRYVTPTKKA